MPPDDDSLSPVGPQLAEITLVTTIPEQGLRTESRLVGDRDEGMALGRVPVGEGIQLAVELRSATKRLIGYGRGPGPITVALDRVVEVPMLVRRPFTYVASGDGVATLDATLDGRAPGYRGAIPLGRQPAVALTTVDGADIVVLAPAGAGGEVTLISTSTHVPRDLPAIPLAHPPVEGAVSIDSRHLVVAHSGAQGGISIVDLEAARAGTAKVEFVPLGSVGAVALAPGSADRPGRVYALLDRPAERRCDPQASSSTVIGVSLADPSAIGPMIPFETPIVDLAVGSDGSLLVANPCEDRIDRIVPTDDTRSVFAEVSRAGAVAVLDNRVWALGVLPAQGATGARLLLVSKGIDGTGEKRDELAAAREGAISVDFSTDGQQAINTMSADDLMPWDLAVIPGADHVAILSWAYFHGRQLGSFFGSPIIPEMEMETLEYNLVNASTAGVVQRLRTACDLTWVSSSANPPVLDDWECAQAPDQDVSDTRFEPRQLSVLYGGR